MLLPKKRKVTDLEFILNDFDIAKSVEVEYRGEILIFEYKEIGRKQEEIERKLFDSKNADITALHVQREVVWHMLKKANVKLFTNEMREKFPPELLDRISLAIAGRQIEIKKNLMD